jgi:CYTH domain-containing protein
VSEAPKGTIKRERRFLLEDFPPGLLRNASHIQIKDNYVTNTRLRLRKIRVPETKARSWSLTQKSCVDNNDLSQTVDSIIWLSPEEYEVLKVFEGNEIRKNRYPYEYNGRTYLIDFYLGALWGLLIAKTELGENESATDITAPDFAVADVTNDPMFSGPRLVDLTIEQIRERFPHTGI